VILLTIFIALIFCFGFVLIFGAPYLPTHKKQAQIALDLLELKKGQTFYELGCGDGRVLNIAAKRGLKAVGYELNPLIYLVARIVTWKNRKLASVVYGNFWKADISKADGIFVFLIDRFMARLDKKLESEANGSSLVSYAFKIPGKKPVIEKEGLYLYRY
jgi:SAM-dependent methyltransferase